MTENPYQPPVSDELLAPRPKLWNPQAASGWSVLFSPVFGSIIHGLNWRVLGDPGKARANFAWAAGNALLILVLVFVPGIELGNKGGYFIGLGVLIAWVYALGKKQIETVKALGPDGYEKKSWTLPLIGGVAGLGVLIAAVFFAISRALSPDAIAVQLKSEVEKAWRANPEVTEAHVDKVVFNSTENHRYKGTVTGSINNEAVTIPISVTVNTSDGTFVWKTGEE